MRRVISMLACAVGFVGFIAGCGEAPVPKSQTDAKLTAAKSGGKDDHSGWWCNEHGVPEEICSLCDSKVAAELQKKGDWCKEHDRADSQCFKCHPELQAKFAAQYEAKFGKQPPEPEVN